MGHKYFSTTLQLLYLLSLYSWVHKAIEKNFPKCEQRTIIFDWILLFQLFKFTSCRETLFLATIPFASYVRHFNYKYNSFYSFILQVQKSQKEKKKNSKDDEKNQGKENSLNENIQY